MSGGSAPPPPDPVATANAQAAANKETAEFNNRANRVNTYGPEGATVYNPIGNDRWEQVTYLSPDQQRIWDQQAEMSIGLGDLGISQTQRVADILDDPYTSRRFNSQEALGDYGSDVEARTMDLATRGMDRAFGRSEEDLRTRLANQGITQDSDAFRSEMEAFNTGKGDAYANALLMSRQQGQADRSQRLAEMESDYSRDVAADLSDRQTPLNEITAIMSGQQLNTPNPGQVYTNTMAPPDIMGAAYNSAGINAQNAAAKNAQKSSTTSAIAGVAGTALMVF